MVPSRYFGKHFLCPPLYLLKIKKYLLLINQTSVLPGTKVFSAVPPSLKNFFFLFPPVTWEGARTGCSRSAPDGISEILSADGLPVQGAVPLRGVFPYDFSSSTFILCEILFLILGFTICRGNQGRRARVPDQDLRRRDIRRNRHVFAYRKAVKFPAYPAHTAGKSKGP